MLPSRGDFYNSESFLSIDEGLSGRRITVTINSRAVKVWSVQDRAISKGDGE